MRFIIIDNAVASRVTELYRLDYKNQWNALHSKADNTRAKNLR